MGMQNANDFHKGVNKDYLQAGREIDAILCDHARLAPVIIGNQCLDFQKQDGITEIEESIQANLLEMRMNELLLKDEAKGYALTAQARPQDGEVFGEFPPRKTLDDVSRYPMLNPVPCSTWNTVFSDEYLIQHSKDRVIDPKVGGMVESIMNKIESPQFRGYAQLITEYLSDSCASNPHSVSKDNGCGRTSYFGLQRPPIVNNYVTLINYGDTANKDLFLLHVLPFAITNSHSQCVVNLSNGGESLKELVTSSLGLKVIDSADVSGLRLFNEINVNNVAKDFEFCLPFQFCSRLFCLGHCKSTIPNDDEFLTEFATSKKWLKLRN